MSLDANLDYGPRNWVTLTIKQSELVHRTNLFFLTMLICGIAPVHNCVFRAYNGKKTLYWAKLSSNVFSRHRSLLSSRLVYVASINIVLLIMCNMSLLNPGPRHLKVFYNNVQGLINTRNLASEDPPLNMTKLHELHGFLFSNKPDILILNETSLKKSVHDDEILPDSYKIYRLDRSLATHPWNQNQPKNLGKMGVEY